MIDSAQMSFKRRLSLFSVLALLLQLVWLSDASAGTFSKALVRFDRMKASQATTGTVCFAPTLTTAIASVQVAFPANFSTSTTTGNWTVSTTNLAWPSGASGLTNVGTANNVTGATGGTVTFPVSPSFTPTAGNLYCFNWTNTAAVTQPSGAASSQSGTITSRDSVPATIDSGSFATATTQSSTPNDQISVSASINPTFTFALANTTDNLGTLTTGSVSTSPTPPTATINTNAKNGWVAWANDTNTGLKSAQAANYTIPSNYSGGTGSNTTLSAGTEGYNLGATSSQTGGTGTITVAAAFVGTSAGQGGGLGPLLQIIASSTGTANNAVLTLKNNAAIRADTPAATDYSDVETIIAAGLF